MYSSFFRVFFNWKTFYDIKKLVEILYLNILYKKHIFLSRYNLDKIECIKSNRNEHTINNEMSIKLFSILSA